MSDQVTKELIRQIGELRARVDRLERAEYVGKAGILGNANASVTEAGAASVKGLAIPYARELTIASGVITVAVTDGWIRVDTEADAGTDDLTTISGGTNGQILVLRTADGARDVVVKNATGNVYCGADVTLSNPVDRLTLQYDSGIGVWVMLAWANNG